MSTPTLMVDIGSPNAGTVYCAECRVEIAPTED